MRPFSNTSRATRRLIHSLHLEIPTSTSVMVDREGNPVVIGNAPSQDEGLAESCRLFPTLRAIDQARGDLVTPFATGPHAAQLEQVARAYMEQHVSEVVWLTGHVDQGHWDALCATLEHERSLLADHDGEVPISA